MGILGCDFGNIALSRVEETTKDHPFYEFSWEKSCGMQGQSSI
jgi:hypothetical protein